MGEPLNLTAFGGAKRGRSFIASPNHAANGSHVTRVFNPN